MPVRERGSVSASGSGDLLVIVTSSRRPAADGRTDGQLRRQTDSVTGVMPGCVFRQRAVTEYEAGGGGCGVGKRMGMGWGGVLVLMLSYGLERRCWSSFPPLCAG